MYIKEIVFKGWLCTNDSWGYVAIIKLTRI